MLLESFVLFATGAVGGMVLGDWLRRLLSVTIPDGFRTELGFVDTSVGTGVAALTLEYRVGVQVGCGNHRGAAGARTDPMVLVRQGGRATIGRGDRRMFDVLVASQTASRSCCWSAPAS